MLRMPDTIVTNTSPLIALVAATGNLDILSKLYERVIVPREVANEIQAGGQSGFGVVEFDEAKHLFIQPELSSIQPLLLNSIDIGEAAVIQTALNQKIMTVCIDEEAGRRVARLSGLKVTGSIGILLKGTPENPDFKKIGVSSNFID